MEHGANVTDGTESVIQRSSRSLIFAVNPEGSTQDLLNDMSNTTVPDDKPVSDGRSIVLGQQGQRWGVASRDWASSNSLLLPCTRRSLILHVRGSKEP